MTILVVDDSDAIRAMLEHCLKALGHEVVPAENGRAARLLLETHDFDAVITDVIMPEADGIDVVINVRKRQPKARIIVTTGGGDYLRADYCVTLAMRLGAHGMILKPFKPSEVVKVLNAVVAAA